MITSSSPCRALYRSLADIQWEWPERRSMHENFCDVLEILAVASGIRPAHLHGAGMMHPDLMGNIERVCKDHGLWTLRTPPIALRWKRGIVRPVEVDDWLARATEESVDDGREVLWVFARPELREQIAALCKFGAPEHYASVLGYPECCAAHHEMRATEMAAAMVSTITQKHRVTSPAAIIELLERGDPVLTVAERERLDATFLRSEPPRMIFPYVSFNACPQCTDFGSHNAARVNRAMRELAFGTGLEFGRGLWEAALLEDRTFGWTFDLNPGNPCPCGSGRTLRDCCQKRQSA